MSFKSWSSAQSAAGKDKPDSNPKAVPAAKLPAAQPGDQVAKASPTKKS
jgi:hypothetical protein